MPKSLFLKKGGGGGGGGGGEAQDRYKNVSEQESF